MEMDTYLEQTTRPAGVSPSSTIIGASEYTLSEKVSPRSG